MNLPAESCLGITGRDTPWDDEQQGPSAHLAAVPGSHGPALSAGGEAQRGNSGRVPQSVPKSLGDSKQIPKTKTMLEGSLEHNDLRC